MPNTRIVFLLVIMSGLLLSSACVDHRNIDETTSSDSETQGSDEKITQNIDVCEPLNVSGVVFPRQEPVEGPRETMAAELVGNLILADSCLQVESLYGDGNVIPVWPAEFTITKENDLIVVLDGDGNPMIREGDEVYMGGGEGTENGMLNCVRQQLPRSCKGQYWYVGEGVRPNLRFDSELFNLGLITATTERMAIFLQKKAILDEWKEGSSTITGNLVLYTPMRCPRIQLVGEEKNFMPIWPLGYSMEFENGEIVISGDSGKVIAREGDLITLTGGSIPHNWESNEYRQLYYQLPQDCHAPYWIVGE